MFVSQENPVCLATQSAGSVNPLAPAGSAPVPTLSKFTEGIQASKFILPSDENFRFLILHTECKRILDSFCLDYIFLTS